MILVDASRRLQALPHSAFPRPIQLRPCYLARRRCARSAIPLDIRRPAVHAATRIYAPPSSHGRPSRLLPPRRRRAGAPRPPRPFRRSLRPGWPRRRRGPSPPIPRRRLLWQRGAPAPSEGSRSTARRHAPLLRHVSGVGVTETRVGPTEPGGGARL